ncbi:MAG: hypothetical protein ACI8TF_002398 [Paracoccaceae bacterium]|jgi:hypothetical protein
MSSMASIRNGPCLLGIIFGIYAMVTENADRTQMKELSVHHVLGGKVPYDEFFMMQPSTT